VNPQVYAVRWKRLYAITLALAGSLAGIAAGSAQESRSIRIAVEGANPPFNYIDQAGELQGFEVDLAKALCAAMRADCTFVQHQWDGIIRGLLDREYDAIVSSLGITESRARRIAFSRRYFKPRAAFLANKSSGLAAMDAQTLAGKVIATLERSPHAAYARDVFPQSELKLFGKLQDAVLELGVGRADVVLGPKRWLLDFLATAEGACCELVGDIPATAPHYGSGIAVGLRKQDPELKAAFDGAIEQAMRDGTYDQIRAKYFQFDTK
jgi:polar amino acid transport system substrate-binding protein